MKVSFQEWLIEYGQKFNTCHNAQGRFCSGAYGFPSDLSELKLVKQLGGTTGASLMEGPDGKQYVVKKGRSEGHIREESYADAIYQAAGVNVPQFQLYETPNGPVKVSEFIQGRLLGDVLRGGGKAAEDAKVNAQRGFAVDVLLSNRDSVGLDFDNMLVDKSGQVWRIDNGGSLRYRAQGMPKSDWGSNPTDFFTLRDRNYNPAAAQVFSSINSKTLTSQVQELSKQKSAILASAPKDLQPTLSERIDKLQTMVGE